MRIDAVEAGVEQPDPGLGERDQHIMAVLVMSSCERTARPRMIWI